MVTEIHRNLIVFVFVVVSLLAGWCHSKPPSVVVDLDLLIDNSKNASLNDSRTLWPNGPDVSFSPREIRQLPVGFETDVQLNITSRMSYDIPFVLRVVSDNPDVIRVSGNHTLTFDGSTTSGNCSVRLRGVFLGRTRLTWYRRLNSTLSAPSYHVTVDGAGGSGERWERIPVEYRASVIRVERAIDRAFVGIVILVVMCVNVGMGCKIDLKVVKEVLRRPVAPSIGFCCQYVIMPLSAYAIVRVGGLRGGAALGLFAMGCAPGGGASNMYTLLLGGDVSLSVTMTLISTAASLAMIPLWLFTLGQQILDSDETSVRIPFVNIIGTLASILAPVAAGVLIQWRRPEWARRILRMLRPLFVIVLLFLFTFGVYVNLYIFRLFTPRLSLCGATLPYAGFLLGGVVAAVLRQPRARVLTVAIETGIQNTGVPILLMKMSLPQPDADLAIVAPVVVSTFTPLPLLLAICINELRKRCCSAKKLPANDDETDGGTEKMIDVKEVESVAVTDETHTCNDEPNGNVVVKQNGVNNGNAPLISS